MFLVLNKFGDIFVIFNPISSKQFPLKEIKLKQRASIIKKSK